MVFAWLWRSTSAIQDAESDTRLRIKSLFPKPEVMAVDRAAKLSNTVKDVHGDEALTTMQHRPSGKQSAANADDIRETLARLASRVSCRDFDGSPIARQTLEDILADGTEAPSSCNQQNWHFIIVSDPSRRLRARDIAGGNPHFADCSALVYLCFQKGWTHGNFSIVQSVAAACYHMMLSAHLRGFHCIWNAGIGDMDALREMLGLQQNFDVIGALAIGRAKAQAPRSKAPRRPVGEVFSWEYFDRPAASIYPVKEADAYPYWEIRNDANPFAQWDPRAWTWDQIADFRGYAVWAKSPLPGVYVSRRQGDALGAEHALLPDLRSGARVAEIMPWGGTTTTALLHRLGGDFSLSVAELSPHNLDFICERVRREGHDTGNMSFDLMPRGMLPYGDGTLDLVVLPQVLEHVPDPEHLLDEVRRVLAVGGKLVASVRNAASAYGDLWRRKESRAQIPNQGPFTPLDAGYVAALIHARFEMEAEIGIGSTAGGDAAVMTGADCHSGRIYALRACSVAT